MSTDFQKESFNKFLIELGEWGKGNWPHVLTWIFMLLSCTVHVLFYYNGIEGKQIRSVLIDPGLHYMELNPNLLQPAILLYSNLHFIFTIYSLHCAFAAFEVLKKKVSIFIKPTAAFKFFIVIFVLLIARTAWDTDFGIVPDLKKLTTDLLWKHPVAELFIIAIGNFAKSLLAVLATVIVSFCIWIATTQYLTKGVQFSEHVFVEGEKEARKHSVVIRNSARKPSAFIYLLEFILGEGAFDVCDVTIKSRLKILLPKCDYETKVQFEEKPVNQLSFNLKVTEDYHAVIHPDGKRYLQIKFEDSLDVFDRLSASPCKCNSSASCKNSRTKMKIALEHKYKRDDILKPECTELDIFEVLKIYEDITQDQKFNIHEPGITFVALVTGKTTLRKKPHKSPLYRLENFTGKKTYYCKVRNKEGKGYGDFAVGLFPDPTRKERLGPIIGD